MFGKTFSIFSVGCESYVSYGFKQYDNCHVGVDDVNAIASFFSFGDGKKEYSNRDMQVVFFYNWEIENIIENTDDKIGVIAGDVISKFDAGRIEKHNAPVVGLNTGKECHLDAHLVGHGLGDLPLDDLDMVIIENVGNLICPVDFDLGSHMRIVVVSVTEGDDTVEKHPLIFQTSDLVVINKVDLADAVGADADKMVNDAKRLNPDVQVIKASLKQGEGLSEIISAINKQKDS